MNWPPMLMHLKFHDDNKDFGLWLPLFLLWPVVLVLFLILSPFILIGVLVLWPSGWGRLALGALRAAGSIVCAMRGLKVDVKNRYQTVYISVV